MENKRVKILVNNFTNISEYWINDKHENDSERCVFISENSWTGININSKFITLIQKKKQILNLIKDNLTLNKN